MSSQRKKTITAAMQPKKEECLPDRQAGNLTIDLSSQPKGIYFVKVQSESKIYTEKVEIQ
ncbi:MAG: T9SS type A sorting domain-containing protein [Bacteroidetes bacterium]|nr:T9SS type A sorting domain-containing protein [Bacteroidota bacterium]